jgi:aspartyl aminopeptidase
VAEKETYELPRKSCFDLKDEAWHDEAFAFSDRYRSFLDVSKTERECAASFAKMAAEHGFVEHVPGEAKGGAPGYLFVGKGKAVALYRPGKLPAARGLNVVIAHTDSPRLDLKGSPLIEEAEVAQLKTHYYGGVRKHQWLSRALAIHGVVILADGSTLPISIGSSKEDPVFVISDLEPHLSRKVQNDKKVTEFYPGEKLNLVAGIVPDDDEEAKNRVKLAVLSILHERYGMTEEDFVSAELEVVPACMARDVGFDRAILGGYGHDDRVCSFTAVRALLEAESLERGGVAFAVDKEEIGSVGATGAGSAFILNTLAEVLALEGETGDLALRRAAEKTAVLSADVGAALHPDWQEVQEKQNAARLGYGLALTKYTGVGGKFGASDANAEFVGRIRRLLNGAGVPWQVSELGKVDEGGGGTVAKFLAAHGMDVLDAGPAVMGLHSPLELVAKCDVYAAYLGYRAFFERFNRESP